MPSNHLILCCPLLLPPSVFLSIRVFSNKSVLCIRWPKYSSVSLEFIQMHSFLWLSNIPLCVCVYIYTHTHIHHSLFIHSSADRHLGCFHVLGIVNSAAMNTEVHVSFSVIVFSGYIPSSATWLPLNTNTNVLSSQTSENFHWTLFPNNVHVQLVYECSWPQTGHKCPSTDQWTSSLDTSTQWNISQ